MRHWLECLEKDSELGTKKVLDLNDQDVWEKKRYAVTAERVGARVSVTRNLGDYNSLSISLMRERDLEDGEDFNTGSDSVFESVEAKVEAKLAEYDE